MVDNTTQDTSKYDMDKVKKGPKKVLIVEDEKPLRDALGDRMKDEGYEVFKAENGKEGLDMALANKPDLVVLDLIMPVMDGKAMLKRLRETPDFKFLPVIVLTNAGDVDNVRTTQFFFNVDDFMVKSNVNMEDIVNRIKQLI